MRREYPKYPLVGVGAVVLVNDRILLVKRRNPPGRMRWSIPGGLVRVNETLVEAVSRELWEETFIVGEVICPIDIFQVIIKDNKSRVKYHYILIDFLVKAKNLNPKPGSDALDAKFFKLDESLKLELTKPTKILINKLIEDLKKNILGRVTHFHELILSED